MRARAIWAGLAAALAGGALAVAVSAHTTHYDSAVNINAFTNGSANNYFYGAVTSDKAKCAPGRKVSVFRKASGADSKFGSYISLSGMTPGAATYTVTSQSGDILPGDYYSKTKRRDLKPEAAHDHICNGAKSSTLPVGP